MNNIICIAGPTASGKTALAVELAKELADVVHYAVAIASLNGIDLNDVILEKDKAASVKYHHRVNLEQFLENR